MFSDGKQCSFVRQIDVDFSCFTIVLGRGMRPNIRFAALCADRFRPQMGFEVGTLRGQGLEHQLCSDRDCWFQRSIDWTSVGIETVDPARGLSLRLQGLQLQHHVDAADHKHIVF